MTMTVRMMSEVVDIRRAEVRLGYMLEVVLREVPEVLTDGGDCSEHMSEQDTAVCP